MVYEVSGICVSLVLSVTGGGKASPPSALRKQRMSSDYGHQGSVNNELLCHLRFQHMSLSTLDSCKQSFSSVLPSLNRLDLAMDEANCDPSVFVHGNDVTKGLFY